MSATLDILLRTNQKPRVQTPWGQADDAGSELADGIVFYTTPSHGGYHLSPDRMKQFRKVFPLFVPFARGPWFEEDEDALVIYLAFHQHATDEQVFHAVRNANRTEASANWLHVASVVAERKDLLARHDAFAASVAGQWEVGGMSSGGDYRDKRWCVFFSNNQGEHRTVIMDYPQKHWYTTEELAGLPTHR